MTQAWPVSCSLSASFLQGGTCQHPRRLSRAHKRASQPPFPNLHLQSLHLCGLWRIVSRNPPQQIRQLLRRAGWRRLPTEVAPRRSQHPRYSRDLGGPTALLFPSLPLFPSSSSSRVRARGGRAPPNPPLPRPGRPPPTSLLPAEKESPQSAHSAASAACAASSASHSAAAVALLAPPPPPAGRCACCVASATAGPSRPAGRLKLRCEYLREW